jgi:hypothetical protein
MLLERDGAEMRQAIKDVHVEADAFRIASVHQLGARPAEHEQAVLQ